MAVRMVSGATFLWLILQHVLPKGFRRARNFGFLHPNSKRLIALLQVVLKVLPTILPLTPRSAFLCPCCGAPMKVVKRRIWGSIDKAIARLHAADQLFADLLALQHETEILGNRQANKRIDLKQITDRLGEIISIAKQDIEVHELHGKHL